MSFHSCLFINFLILICSSCPMKHGYQLETCVQHAMGMLTNPKRVGYYRHIRTLVYVVLKFRMGTVICFLVKAKISLQTVKL